MNRNMTHSVISFLFLCIVLCSCTKINDTVEHKLSQKVEKTYFDNLSTPFSELSQQERDSDWGKEYRIAKKFGEEFDLYRSVSTFKRAAALIDPNEERALEITYYTVLSYYLGKRYQEAIDVFESSELSHVDESFAAFHDLLVVLYDAYLHTNEDKKQECIATILHKKFPHTHTNLITGTSLMHADLESLQALTHPSQPAQLYDEFQKNKKSIRLAQGLNAVLPGAGYFYVGQKTSAMTAVFLNGLFISACYYFFSKGNLAAGLITASFEMGWYFGGIHGAGESAKYYNERLYHRQATSLLTEHQLFPILQLKYGF
jgi:tetratricopeptide (TPR) repeat protein